MGGYRGLASFFLLGLIILTEARIHEEMVFDESPLNEEDAVQNLVRSLPRTRVEDVEDCLTELPIFSQRSLVHNLCDNMCDGIYSLGCVPDYIACSGGMTHNMQCPEGLVLDPETKKCQYRELVKECQHEGAVTSTEGTTIPPTNGAEPPVTTVFSTTSTSSASASVTPYPVASSTTSTSSASASVTPYPVASSTTSTAAAPASVTPYPVASSTTVQYTISTTQNVLSEMPYTETSSTTTQASKVRKTHSSTVSTTPCPLGSSTTAQSTYKTTIATAPTVTTRSFVPSTTSRTTIPPTGCPTSSATTAVPTPCPAEPCPETTTKAPAPCPLVSTTTKRSMTPTQATKTTRRPSDFDISFTCESKEDGLYAVECSSIIIACFEGAMVILPCPDGMRFEPILGLFLHKDKENICQSTIVRPVPENETTIIENANMTAVENETNSFSENENENMTMSVTANNVTSLNETEFMNTTNIEVMLPPKDKELMVCQSVANGICNFGCSSEAVACAFGQVIFIIRCSLGSKFDISSLSCRNESFVSACSSNNTLSPLTNVTSMNTTEEEEEEVKMAPPSSEAPPVPAEPNLCEGLADGMYAKGCSAEFVSCVQGNASLLYCPEGAAYDTDSHSCLPKESVALCGGTIPEAVCVKCAKQRGVEKSTVSPTKMGTTATVRPPVVQTTTPSAANNFSFSCVNLPDGFYDLGCNTEFIACVAERAIPMQCPANLKYDSISDKCLAACDVGVCRNISKEECSAELTTTEGPNVNVSIECNENINGTATNETIVLFVNEAGFVEQNPPGGSEPVVGGDFICNSLGNGTFACGCSSRFIACLRGKAFAVECPSNLKFDSETNQCLEEQLVKDCPESNSANESQNNTAGTSVNETSTSGFSCEGKADGAYELGCSSHFIICISDNAYDMYCPSQTLKFDEEAQQCLSACVVPACISGSVNETAEGQQPEATPTEQTTLGPATQSTQLLTTPANNEQGTQRTTLASGAQPTNEPAPATEQTSSPTAEGQESEGEQPSNNSITEEPGQGAALNSTVTVGQLPSNSTEGQEVETVLGEATSDNSTTTIGQSASNTTVEN